MPAKAITARHKKCDEVARRGASQSSNLSLPNGAAVAPQRDEWWRSNGAVVASRNAASRHGRRREATLGRLTHTNRGPGVAKIADNAVG